MIILCCNIDRGSVPLPSTIVIFRNLVINFFRFFRFFFFCVNDSKGFVFLSSAFHTNWRGADVESEVFVENFYQPNLSAYLQQMLEGNLPPLIWVVPGRYLIKAACTNLICMRKQRTKPTPQKTISEPADILQVVLFTTMLQYVCSVGFFLNPQLHISSSLYISAFYRKQRCHDAHLICSSCPFHFLIKGGHNLYIF